MLVKLEGGKYYMANNNNNNKKSYFSALCRHPLQICIRHGRLGLHLPLTVYILSDNGHPLLQQKEEKHFVMLLAELCRMNKKKQNRELTAGKAAAQASASSPGSSPPAAPPVSPAEPPTAPSSWELTMTSSAVVAGVGERVSSI